MNLNAIDAIDLKMADFDRIHNVNLRSATNLSLLALPHLIKTKGNIVNVSSVAAWLPVCLKFFKFLSLRQQITYVLYLFILTVILLSR